MSISEKKYVVPEDDESWVKSRYPNSDCLGGFQVQNDGVYFSIAGIPGFRLISYLGKKNAWKAAREFIETGVQRACGRVVPPTATSPEPEVLTEIANLLWDGVPADSEHQTASDLHNTLILAAYLRGKKAGTK